jgi:hypothetical protein
MQDACKGEIHYRLSSYEISLRLEKICELCNGTTEEYERGTQMFQLPGVMTHGRDAGDGHHDERSDRIAYWGTPFIL